MAQKRARGRKGLGTAVKRRIYRYGKQGRVEGFQARMKRAGKGKDRKAESISMYFSFAHHGRGAALAKAERWLRENERWMTDRRFKPQTLKRRPAARKSTRKPDLKVLRGGGRGSPKSGSRKHARAA